MKLCDMAALLAILAALAIAPTVSAQTAAGTWTGETSGAIGGVRPISLSLASDGTGTMRVDVAREVLDLQIEGNEISFGFRPLILGQPANFVFRYDGEFDGDTMTLYVALDRGNGETTRSDEPLVLTRR